MWNQIRRTGEALIEMGTIEGALLQGLRVGTRGTVRTDAEPSKMGA